MSRKDEITNRIIEICLISLIIFTTLALGTVQPWSIFVMRIVVVVALIAWLIKILFQPANRQTNLPNVECRSTPLLLPLSIYLFIAIISTIISPYKWISLNLLANLFVYTAVYFMIVNNLKNFSIKCQINNQSINY